MDHKFSGKILIFFLRMDTLASKLDIQQLLGIVFVLEKSYKIMVLFMIWLWLCLDANHSREGLQKQLS